MDTEGYQKTAEHEADHWWFRARRDLVLSQVAIASKALGGSPKILDFGCGTGFNLGFLSEYGESFGADLLEHPYNNPSEERYFNLSNDCSTWKNSFQLLTALDVLEHIEDEREGLLKMLSFLQPGGELILTVPAYNWLWSGEDDVSEHKRRYTKKYLALILKRQGLELQFLSYFNCALLPIVSLVVFYQRYIERPKEATSDLRRHSTLVNELLYRISSTELKLIGSEAFSAPAGASIICRAPLPK